VAKAAGAVSAPAARRSPINQWIRRVAAVALAAAALVVSARVIADHYHGDTLWRNALASLGGTQRNGDFGYIFLPAGDDVIGGRNPYLDPDAILGPAQAPYAYPPVLAFLVVPFSAMPERVRGTFLPGVLFSLLLIGAVVGAMALFDVRDWRCYPLALAYPVTVETIEYGALGPLLLLLIAAAWRFRDRAWLSGGATGVAVVLKLFLWPLVLWLAMTQRIKAAGIAILATVGLAVLSWSLIAFQGLTNYPRLLQKLVDVEGGNSYSTFALLRMLGLPEVAARATELVIGAVLLGLAWHASRVVGPARQRDAHALVLTVAGALVMTPILWLHYLVLLLVPISLARPRLSPLWFVPLGLTVFEALDWYRGWPYGDAKALLSVAVVVTIVFAAALLPSTAWMDSRRHRDRSAAAL